MPEQTKYHHVASGYARVDASLIDHCVEAVRDANEAIEADDRVFTAVDMIITARAVLEAERIFETVGPDLDLDLPELEGVGDWTLTCVATMLGEVSAALVKRGQTSAANHVRTREFALLRRVAKSPWCSPMVSYNEVFRVLVDDCERRRDPEGLIFQAGYIVSDQNYQSGSNLLGSLSRVGWLHHSLGHRERAMDIFTKLVGYDPTHVWTYNSLAIMFARDLPEVALAAAKRGLEVIGNDDNERIANQLRRFVVELDGKKDGPRPANTNALLAALRVTAEHRPMTTKKLMKFVSPETAGVAKKLREPLPSAPELRQLREDLRSLPRSAPGFVRPSPVTPPKPLPPPAPLALAAGPTALAVARSSTSGSKIGRNEACPCGTGKKYKRCCGG
ncbi:MAG: SEC-C metal-binding domain-containing protein [Deltaproteobacteria bacterium]|nr:SEC-C metal-binding domain-containing protein [Deltaproteobacteria bacterium]